MIVVGIYAITTSGVSAPELFNTGGVTNVFQAAAVGVFLYVGFEWVTPLAEEVTESSMIPKGMMIAIGLLCISYVIFITGMTAVVPKETLAVSKIPHIICRQRVVREGRYLLVRRHELPCVADVLQCGFFEFFAVHIRHGAG